jgi:hypothetical protein
MVLNNRSKPLNLEALKKALGRKRAKFLGKTQQDAQ